MKPPFAYHGGKVGMAPKIVALLPPHRTYLEPYLGSGAVFFAKEPSRNEILNDLDDAVVTFFRVLRERPAELEEACRLTPYHRTEWEAADLRQPADTDLEHARRFWVRINQSFLKIGHHRTGWSRTTGANTSPARSTKSRLARFAAAADRLADAMIENTDAVTLIEGIADEETVIYADPPYVHATRRSTDAGGSKSDYRHEMTEEDHRRLAKTLHETRAVVLLSGYPGDLYDELYTDWWTQDFHVTVHSSNARSSTRGGRTERVWVNRPPDDLFHQ